MQNRRTSQPRHQQTGLVTKAKALVYTYLDNKKKIRGGLIAFLIILALGGGTLAFADTPSSSNPTAGQTCTTTGNTTVCINQAKVDETKPVLFVKTNTTTAKYENILEKGYKTSAKCYKGSTPKSILKAHPGAKCIIITKAGFVYTSTVRYVGGHIVKYKQTITKSMLGTNKAKFYWDSFKKVWRNADCGNYSYFTGAIPKLVIKSSQIVRKLTTTVTGTIDYSNTREVTAKSVCSNDAVSAYGLGYALSASAIRQTLTATAQTVSEAKAQFSADYLKITQKLAQQVLVSAKGTISNKVVASAEAGCTLKVQPKQITVCQLNGQHIVTINESDFDSTKYSRNLDDCKVVVPPVTYIPVCRLADKTVMTIDATKFDDKLYSKDLSMCQSVPPTPPVQIQVCRLADKTIVTINESDFDSTKYSKNQADCNPPAPKQIQVCRLADKQVVTIGEDQFTSDKYSKNLDDCKVVIPPAVSTVTLNVKNDVDQSTVDPGTGKPDYSTSPVFFEYDLAIPTAKVQVTSQYGGSFTGAPATVSKGGSRVNFIYVATSDPSMGYDILTVNLIDPNTGKVIATNQQKITINKTPTIPNS